MISVLFAFACLVVGRAAASNGGYGGYEPLTVVTDQAGIAGDLERIEYYVGFPDETNFQIAQDIYKQGGNSKSYALIDLAVPLSNEVQKGKVITGINAAGNTVRGYALKTYPVLSMILAMQYQTGSDFLNYVQCKEGALPSNDEAVVTSGCLNDNAVNGALEITVEDLGTIAYRSVVNKNARTLMEFSSDANARMRPGGDLSKSYFPFFQPYVDYYGAADFGHQIATAGFDGTETNLLNGDVNLAGYGFEARAQIAEKAVNYINNALYVQRELYDAYDDCRIGCTAAGCNDDDVHSLDEAAAFFVGNRLADDPNEEGNLYFALGKKRCANFIRCENRLTGDAIVNKRIIAEFQALKPLFNSGHCELTLPHVEEIIRLMMIPVIQGTLRYAELTSRLDQPTEAMQAEGALFAATILPLLHKCSSSAAATVYDNMKLANGNTKANFAAVKQAIESCYEYYHIECAEVGGIKNETTKTTYIHGAEPCNSVDVQGSSARGLFSIGTSATVVGVLGAGAALLMLT